MVTCHYCCEACLDTAQDAILAEWPDLSLEEATDLAVDARSEREHPCSGHA